jgi:hypothetical protein
MVPFRSAPYSSLDKGVLPMLDSLDRTEDSQAQTYLFYNESERGFSVIYSNWGRDGQRFNECNSAPFDLINVGPIEKAGEGINRAFSECSTSEYVVVDTSSIFEPTSLPNVQILR